jgi:predicted type IV restriction endonuclease
MIDDNQRKIICQLKFTSNTMKILIPSGDFIKEHEIENIDEIIKFKIEIIERTLLLLES